jgi:hypothetical protein
LRRRRSLDAKPRSAVIGRLAGALFALAPVVVAAQAPARTAALAGTVRDTLGHPLRLVAVSVENSQITAVTDDSGRFHLKGIPAGRNDFALRRIGFSPVEFATTVAADSTLVIDVRMKALQTLDAVTVTTTGPVALHRAGFYERKQLGLGSFIPPEKIDSLSNLPQGSMMVVSTLARGVRRVCPRAAHNVCDIQLRSAACRWLFIDGHQVDGAFDEQVVPTEIAAIEIYDRVPLVPAEFQGRLPPSRGLSPGSAGCGAVVVWTKGRVRAP